VATLSRDEIYYNYMRLEDSVYYMRLSLLSKHGQHQNPSLETAMSPTAATRMTPDAANSHMFRRPLISPNTSTQGLTLFHFPA